MLDEWDLLGIADLTEKKTMLHQLEDICDNIDDFEELSESYRVETIPTLLVLRNGIASEPLIAPQAKSLITDWLKDNQVL